MSKLKECYYVISFEFSDKFVKKIEPVGTFFGGYDVTYDNVGVVVRSIAMCNSQREAKRVRRENGGIILKGLREVTKNE